MAHLGVRTGKRGEWVYSGLRHRNSWNQIVLCCLLTRSSLTDSFLRPLDCPVCHVHGLVGSSLLIALSLIMRSVCPGRNWGHTSHWSLGTLLIRQEGDPAARPLCLVHGAEGGGVGISDQACQDKRPGRGTPVTYF